MYHNVLFGRVDIYPLRDRQTHPFQKLKEILAEFGHFTRYYITSFVGPLTHLGKCHLYNLNLICSQAWPTAWRSPPSKLLGFLPRNTRPSHHLIHLHSICFPHLWPSSSTLSWTPQAWGSCHPCWPSVTGPPGSCAVDPSSSCCPPWAQRVYSSRNPPCLRLLGHSKSSYVSCLPKE